MNCEKFISLANDIKNDVCIFGAGDYDLILFNSSKYVSK